MINVLAGVDVVNWVLRHPCTYYKKENLYVPAWVSLQRIFESINPSSVKYAVQVKISTDNNPHSVVIDYIQNNPGFIIALMVLV